MAARTGLLPAENNMLWLSPTASGDSPTLKVISQVVASAGLLNARPAESLHISIGAPMPLSRAWHSWMRHVGSSPLRNVALEQSDCKLRSS